MQAATTPSTQFPFPCVGQKIALFTVCASFPPKSLDNAYTKMITYVMLSRQIILPRPFPTKLTPFLRYSCGLLPLFLRVVSLVFNSLQPLLPKTGGWGGLAHVIPDLARRTHRFFTLLFSCSYKSLFQQLPSFHIYTKRGVFFASWMEFAHPHSQIRNLLGAPPRSLRPPAAGRPARHRAGLSLILLFFGFSERFKPFNFQLSTVNRPYSFASSEPFKPFNFQLSTVNRPSPQLECL